jgi:hypothetical protein
VERAHRDAPLPGQHSRPAGTQLGERDLDGDAHRAQGRNRGREGSGADDARSDDEADPHHAGWDYFHNVQTKDIKYYPLMRPEDKPPIWMNKVMMDRVRPEMRKFYFDPTKHKTYLEQLGIKYPMVRDSTKIVP